MIQKNSGRNFAAVNSPLEYYCGGRALGAVKIYPAIESIGAKKNSITNAVMLKIWVINLLL